MQPGPDWVTRFHGIRIYGLWSLLRTGIVAESNSRDAGHDYWVPGVNVTPSITRAKWYARPHVMFGDGAFHRCLVHVLVNEQEMRASRPQGCVFPKEAVAIIGIWFWPNCGCDDPTVERFSAWQPHMEAVPTDCEPLPPVVNPGKEGFEPWFERSEDWPIQACRDPMGPQTFAEVRASDLEVPNVGGERPTVPNAEGGGPHVGQR